MRSIFNENFTEKNTHRSHGQCTGSQDPPSKNAPLKKHVKRAFQTALKLYFGVFG